MPQLTMKARGTSGVAARMKGKTHFCQLGKRDEELEDFLIIHLHGNRAVNTLSGAPNCLRSTPPTTCDKDAAVPHYRNLAVVDRSITCGEKNTDWSKLQRWHATVRYITAYEG